VTTVSIVVPAHNEERSIRRLLDALTVDAAPGEFEIIVVCNGCTDTTAAIAAGYAPAVRVVDLPEPSKRAALKRGDVEAGSFPRLYVDADVVVDATTVRRLAQALRGPVLAAAPTRVLPRDGVGRLVRAYYDVWEQLPQVRSALFGRGVIAVSATGHERIRALPPAMSDDLAMSAAFATGEQTVVSDAAVTVWPPRTLRDLMRRRIRVNTGNAELDQGGARPTELKTSPRTVLRVARTNPRLIPSVAVFLSVAVASKIAARRRVARGDFDTWLRDESSRQASG
jgi:glycosyltransferase involved in cell wall biosynthesis